MPRRRPNVVLVVLDSVRQDHVSCYGYERATTPNIDRIAAEGLVFENAYSSSCWTIPAHASLFTGRLPSEHGADFDTWKLGVEHPTLAQRLTEEGYRTASITCNAFIGSDTGLDRGFRTTADVGALAGGGDGVVGRAVRYLHGRLRQRTARDRGAGRATELARRWLRRQARDGEPFFLFMNYMECHLPYRLRHPDRHRFVEPDDRRATDTVPQDPFAVMAGRSTLSRQSLERLVALYDGSLFHLDRRIGEIDDELRRLGLVDDTMLVVLSDHGESFGEHGLLDHQYGLFEHLVRVPLVIRLPGARDAGSREGRPVQVMDLFTAIIRWTGGETTDAPGTAPGGLPVRDAVVTEYLVPNIAAMRRRFPDMDPSRFDVAMRAVRQGSDKLIQQSDGTTRLFDLDADPAERRDLARQRPDVVKRLADLLVREAGPWRDRSGEKAPEPSAEVRDRLTALGYL